MVTRRDRDDGPDDEVHDDSADKRVGRAALGIAGTIVAALGGWLVLDFVQAPASSEARISTNVGSLANQLDEEEAALNELRLQVARYQADFESLRAKVGEIDAAVSGLRSSLSVRNAFDEDDFRRERKIIDVQLDSLQRELDHLHKVVDREVE